MDCEDSIDIRAKGRGREATVSLRQRELIRNLRALVAVRFEQAIARIVLVFAGQVLGDEGTIDSKGIVSGVTVHVVCRAEVGHCSFPKPSPSTSDPMRSRCLAILLEDPGALRLLLQSDPRIRMLVEENATLRHYLESDQNLREMLTNAFSPAQLELERRRDLYISRLEFVPGGYKVLGRLNYYKQQAYEDNVAMSFQQASPSTAKYSNPQRGRENKDPLPNPWLRTSELSLPDFNTAADQKRMDDLFNRILTEPMPGTQNEGARREAVNLKRSPSPYPTVIKRTDPRSRREGRWQECYHAQLEQLVQMGYLNRRRNKRALMISLGNVDSAVRLLDHWDRSVDE
ncbi:ubiquilin-3 [Drosophila elegans]|uniref:ubiquilin-3 n=1 Tax=Drosophila elegans TaxID=30023 RepID=UPI0007E72F23|nr:ubiquilin-3 [Drosophila elegans]